MIEKITREDHNWGTVLHYRPFPRGNEYLWLAHIYVEIKEPNGNKNPRIRAWWGGVSVKGKMSLAEVQIWQNALNVMLKMAHEIAEEMKPKRKVARKKKAAPKRKKKPKK